MPLITSEHCKCITCILIETRFFHTFFKITVLWKIFKRSRQFLLDHCLNVTNASGGMDGYYRLNWIKLIFRTFSEKETQNFFTKTEVWSTSTTLSKQMQMVIKIRPGLSQSRETGEWRNCPGPVITYWVTNTDFMKFTQNA